MMCGWKGIFWFLMQILDADKVLLATRDEYVFRPAMYKYMIEYADAKRRKRLSGNIWRLYKRNRRLRTREVMVK